jgi:formylglycine-generating enzyme required for sulfatase activity
MVGTEEVNADRSGTMRDVKTNDLLRNLEFGKEYSLELSYLYGEDRYEGSCTFTADWKGVKEFSIEMRKSVDILLEKAYKLADEKSWAEVQLNCQRIFELDKTNKEALKLKEMAILELTSNLKIKAMIGTELVDADIGGLENEVNSNGIIRNLEFNKEYTLNLSCMYLGDKYEGFCTFTTNWKGLKEMIVEMRKSVEILLEKAQKLVNKKSWLEVQAVCKQILELDNNNEIAKRLNLDAEIALSSNPRLMAIPKIENQPQKEIKEKKVIQLGNKVNIQISNKQIIQMIKINNNMWMGKFEITQEQFEFIMGYNPSVNVNFQNPVESLSWEEANSFCNKLTFYCINNDLIPKGFHFTLPNMHEWHKALKDTCTKEIKSLKSTSDISVIVFYTNQICWYHGNSSGRHHIVGTKFSTGKNLYDLLGNVSEWCSNSHNESNNIRYCIGGNFNSTRSSIIESLTIENSGAWVNAKGGKHIGFRVVLVPTR